MLQPVPAPTAENRPFWDGMASGCLTLACCARCGRIPFPPLPRCPRCLSDALVWQELSGRARLVGWTENHLIAGPPAPVCLAECTLEEDPHTKIVAIVETADVRDLPADAPIRLMVKSTISDWPLLCAIAAPAAEAGGPAL